MLSQLSLFDIVTITTAAFVLGLSKSGIKGISIIIVALMALVFEARASTGILLPMLIVGDVFAVIYYNRHAQWKYLFRLMPFMMAGVIVGTIAGDHMSAHAFRKSMALVIFISVIIMFWWDQRKSKKVPQHLSFAGVMGLTAGFTTMVGNLAGSFANIFFLAMRLPKDAFIGTTAWLFLIINLFKVPFHVWSWGTINWPTLQVSLTFTPAIFLGLFIGVRLLKRVNEQFFRKFILFMTAVGALFIYFS
ncbi:sulfite exporter TauE/SafE family protein [Roseivirga sp. UBA1976]|uniref:sulfite exporter TauE/SafE family protein n=1 Tax=Roseivirga sp. UBA1976 TaxID=1947386 RepID=UPI002579E273|nr:sulfite exporter TauE/SafE family protein [Roseivirga sp. UBA1976]MEC7755642.1 sulfite exporter TauE/SafE family protein [Bacteroidota bacterium]|tara:strand:+ start:150 stop:893 length:744 start_codon:yes stop_codon:yes gene_type:complete